MSGYEHSAPQRIPFPIPRDFAAFERDWMAVGDDPWCVFHSLDGGNR